jgi:hypothetical protein
MNGYLFGNFDLKFYIKIHLVSRLDSKIHLVFGLDSIKPVRIFEIEKRKSSTVWKKDGKCV